MTFPDGSKEGYLSITPVNSNKVPMPPPNGMQPQLIVTIQPHNARFDPPAQLTLPNVDDHAPGAEVEMYSYDHDLEEFVTIGVGTVSKDGSLITSNEGTGVIKAGWHCGSPPGGSGCCSSDNGGCGHCYDPRGTCAEGCVFQPERRAKEQTEGNCQSELCKGSEEDNSDTPEDTTESGDCKVSGCVDGQVANDLFDSNDAPDDEFGCYVCDPESKSPRRDPNKSLPESEQSPDDCKDLKCVHWESKDETSELKNNYPCKKCSSGRVIDDNDHQPADKCKFCENGELRNYGGQVLESNVEKTVSVPAEVSAKAEAFLRRFGIGYDGSFEGTATATVRGCCEDGVRGEEWEGTVGVGAKINASVQLWPCTGCPPPDIEIDVSTAMAFVIVGLKASGGIYANGEISVNGSVTANYSDCKGTCYGAGLSASGKLDVVAGVSGSVSYVQGGPLLPDVSLTGTVTAEVGGSGSAMGSVSGNTCSDFDGNFCFNGVSAVGSLVGEVTYDGVKYGDRISIRTPSVLGNCEVNAQ